MTKPAHNHKSTTVAERYYHFNDAERRGTVFFRQLSGDWVASASFAHSKDPFNRSVGRTTARRKWFDRLRKRFTNIYYCSGLYPLTYEHAQRAFDHELALRKQEAAERRRVK